MMCPICGRFVDPDDCVYTNIMDPDTHPAYMIYVPTCECSHQFKERPEHTIYGGGYEPGVTWFGGIRLSSFENKRRMEVI